MHLLLNVSNCVKSYGHFCQSSAIFTMSTHQTRHVTHIANFENFYFVLILHLMLGKVTEFLVEVLSTSEVISQKPPPSPSAFRVMDALD